MDLGVLEGQTRRDYFLNSIFDPSLNQCTVEYSGSFDALYTKFSPVSRIQYIVDLA